ncbi:uncharacterized protein C21orf58 homolog [Genypterus blacodes]|uniref:uncharacterized protein C21orf58 homolog n=1 Tax=Genypterus blacodes TaxID=154954 RepID=UPI003F76F45B
MTDPMVNQMARLRLRLLERRLENEKDNMDGRAGSAQSVRSCDGQMDALSHALRRKQDLLQRLREQLMLEDLTRPHTWGGTRRHHHSDYRIVPQPPPPPPPPPPLGADDIQHHALTMPCLHPPPPPPPRIIQQTLPQQRATIIQQLPQQQPLITQIPPPQPYPAPRSGSIKEDMVELMLMQNAQMHQIVMHNMMLKAIPPMGPAPSGGPSPTSYPGQDIPVAVYLRPEVKPRGSAVHHHHHYGPTAATSHLLPISYPTWLPMISPAPTAPAGGYLPSIHHVTAPITLPPLNG